MSKNATTGQTSPLADEIPEFNPGDIVDDPRVMTNMPPPRRKKMSTTGRIIITTPTRRGQTNRPLLKKLPLLKRS